MPFKRGVEFFEDQIKKGCKCKHFFLMSGDFSNEDLSKAKLLGLNTFVKPFRLEDITNMLDQIEKEIDPKRQLSDWFLSKMPKIKSDYPNKDQNK